MFHFNIYSKILSYNLYPVTSIVTCRLLFYQRVPFCVVLITFILNINYQSEISTKLRIVHDIRLNPTHVFSSSLCPFLTCFLLYLFPLLSETPFECAKWGLGYKKNHIHNVTDKTPSWSFLKCQKAQFKRRIASSFACALTCTKSHFWFTLFARNNG